MFVKEAAEEDALELQSRNWRTVRAAGCQCSLEDTIACPVSTEEVEEVEEDEVAVFWPRSTLYWYSALKRGP